MKAKIKTIASYTALSAIVMFAFIFGYREGRLSEQQDLRQRIDQIEQLIGSNPNHASPTIIERKPTDDDIANYFFKEINQSAKSANLTITMNEGRTEGNLSITFGNGGN